MAFKKEFDALYQSVANDLQKLQASLQKDIKSTSEQLNALSASVESANNNEEVMREFRYTQKQIQSLYTGMEDVVQEQVAPSSDKLAGLDEIKAAIAELTELKYNYQQLQAAYESLAANMNVHTEAFDYERLADMVAERMAAKEHSYDVVLDEAGIEAIAEKVAQKLGAEEEVSYELVLDEEGLDAIAKGVANELRCQCTCAPAEEPCVCEPAEEVCACEPVEEPVEEPVVEEAPVAEPVVETPASVKTEIAVSEDVIVLPDDFDESNLVDAETGLVIRLKKSFTAKLKQSEDDVKAYYGLIKNELTSYKKINSNVSWHGDRFNFGRDTIAKINICGKTLCLYLALDPEDPEFKTTVYHQKNVGGQKAYESTPFMVKVKSDAAAKKAVRLAAALAEKLAAEKEENFVEVDYVEEYAYETTKKLYEDGFIKATKEKKVDLNF